MNDFLRQYFDSSDSTRIVNTLTELMGEDMSDKISNAYTKSIDLPSEKMLGTFSDNLYGQTIYKSGKPTSYKINVSHTPYWNNGSESGISSRKFTSNKYFKDRGATDSWRLITYPKTTAEHESIHSIMANLFGKQEKGTPFARTETVPYYIQALAVRPFYKELSEKFPKRAKPWIDRNESLIKELKKLSEKEYKEFSK